jgi:hypothetical protein
MYRFQLMVLAAALPLAAAAKEEFVAYAGRKFDRMKKTDNMVSVQDMARAIARGNTKPDAAKP